MNVRTIKFCIFLRCLTQHRHPIRIVVLIISLDQAQTAIALVTDLTTVIADILKLAVYTIHIWLRVTVRLKRIVLGADRGRRCHRIVVGRRRRGSRSSRGRRVQR